MREMQSSSWYGRRSLRCRRLRSIGPRHRGGDPRHRPKLTRTTVTRYGDAAFLGPPRFFDGEMKMNRRECLQIVEVLPENRLETGSVARPTALADGEIK